MKKILKYTINNVVSIRNHNVEESNKKVCFKVNKNYILEYKFDQ